MLHISIDVAPLLERFERMEERIAGFGSVDMPTELTEWQEEDMNRRYPNTVVPDSKTALTHIWPRSRLSERRSYERTRERRRRPSLSRAPAFRGGTRPILRPELFERLCQRMAALLPEKLRW
jgi:hypothetical protein